ncbi:hypothetical protein ACLOJK_013836 [Asimina triloba]
MIFAVAKHSFLLRARASSSSSFEDFALGNVPSFHSSMEIPFPPLSRCSGKSPSCVGAPISEDSTFEGHRSPKECEEEVSSAAVLPLLSDGLHFMPAGQSCPTAGDSPPPELPPRSLAKGRVLRRRNNRMARPSATSASSSSCPVAASAAATSQQQRGVRFALRRRSLPGVHGLRTGHDVEALALPLGMSMAAVVAQKPWYGSLNKKFNTVMYRYDNPVAPLAEKATKPVVKLRIWDVVDGITGILQLIPFDWDKVLERKNAEGEKPPSDHLSMVPSVIRTICTEAMKESVASVFGHRFDGFMRNLEASFSTTLKTLQLLNQASANEERDSMCRSDAMYSHLEGPSAPDDHREQPDDNEEICEKAPSHSIDQQLIVHSSANQQLAGASCGASGFGHDNSFLNTFEKSVMEQARLNDLKTYELGLTLRRLRLKESQLALSSDTNSLERCKLSMGISKASFKAEKLKSQLEDTRHAELLKKCIDCLAAGLLIMSACLIYAAYVYSYERIVEATNSCTSPPKRSAASRQIMPVTIILLLLGVACGLFGKLCVDTLGGNGYCWLLHWEFLCLLHFFANVRTPSLFYILHGPVSVSQEAQKEFRFPHWIRRFLFYSMMLLILPVLCGLMPFASLSEWKDHFSSIVTDHDKCYRLLVMGESLLSKRVTCIHRKQDSGREGLGLEYTNPNLKLPQKFRRAGEDTALDLVHA